MVGMILSTDMAKHMQDLTQFKNRMESKSIKSDLHNGHLFIDKTDATTTFETQQQLLEMCMHACDLSYATRDFQIVKHWVYLLFEEFFNQGDIEKSSGLPVSFLCDRETTTIAPNQPGFMNFIVLPLFKAVSQVMPECDIYLQGAIQNSATWKEYQETDSDKQVYKKKNDVSSDDSDLSHKIASL